MLVFGYFKCSIVCLYIVLFMLGFCYCCSLWVGRSGVFLGGGQVSQGFAHGLLDRLRPDPHLRPWDLTSDRKDMDTSG